MGVVGALVASLVALAPAAAAPARQAAKPRISLISRGAIGSFTPASADPRLAAALSRSGMTANAFRFTPATSLRINRSVTVAVRARTNRQQAAQAPSQQVALVAPTASSIAPVAYNLGLSLGWRKFAVTGDMEKLDLVGVGRRDVMDVGVSYTMDRLTTRVQLAADRAMGVTPRSMAKERGYSVDFGGSYALSSDLDVTAGVRYRAEHEQQVLTRGDDRRDSQAVYIGTAVRF